MQRPWDGSKLGIFQAQTGRLYTCMGSKGRYETREAGRGQARLGKELQLIPGTMGGHQKVVSEE